MIEVDLSKPDAVTAGARSRAYLLLSRAFRYPADGSWADLPSAIADALSALPHVSALPALDQPPKPEDYVAAFEVGGAYGPPCFIYEGEYGGGRLKVMEDVLRFYDFFGLQPVQDDGRRDRPDHLATELEFMHALTFLEATSLEKDESPLVFRQAQKEFLRFHLVDFTAAVASRLGEAGVPFYTAVAEIARDLCAQELEYLARLLEAEA